MPVHRWTDAVVLDLRATTGPATVTLGSNLCVLSILLTQTSVMPYQCCWPAGCLAAMQDWLRLLAM
jgi:hypothetical protein